MGPRATAGFDMAPKGRVHLFATGRDGRLYWKEWPKGAGNTPWAGPISDTVLGAPPTAVARGQLGLWAGVDLLQVFAIGTDNQLYSWRWPANMPAQAFPSTASWGSPFGLGEHLTSAPEAVSDSLNRMNVFARGRNNELLHLRFEERSVGAFPHWQRWEDLGGALASAPRAVAPWASYGPGRLHVFIQDQNNYLQHRWFDGTSWGKWMRLASGVTARPGAAPIGGGDTVLLAYNESGSIGTRLWDNGTWGPPTFLAGGVAPTSEPCVHAPTVNELQAGYGPLAYAQVLAQDANGLLVAKRHQTQEWTPRNTWQHVGGGAIVSPPEARGRSPFSVGPMSIDVFARGTNDAAYHWTFP